MLAGVVGEEHTARAHLDVAHRILAMIPSARKLYASASVRMPYRRRSSADTLTVNAGTAVLVADFEAVVLTVSPSKASRSSMSCARTSTALASAAHRSNIVRAPVSGTILINFMTAARRTTPCFWLA